MDHVRDLCPACFDDGPHWVVDDGPRTVECRGCGEYFTAPDPWRVN